MKSEGRLLSGVMQLSSRRSRTLEEGRSRGRGHKPEDGNSHSGLISSSCKTARA